MKKTLSLIAMILVLSAMCMVAQQPVFGQDGDGEDTKEVAELEIRNFGIQLFYGASKNDKGDWVWTAGSSASGHRFSFRINYAISGKFDLGPESIEMRIPKQILRDRAGMFADKYDMSIPSKSEIEDGEEVGQDINYAYYEDGDDIVIYNFRDVYTGENGYIEVSYLTSQSTFNYVDYGADGCASDPFYATIRATGNGKTVEAESERIPVNINTRATISSTSKQFPTKYNSWKSSWGTAPADADDYYYLLWELKTVINKPTQPYDFHINDTLVTEPGDVVGYRFRGESVFSDNNCARYQTYEGERFDYVLTRHPKEYWDTLDHWEILNKEVATVDPFDQVDEDTSAQAQKKFVWNKTHFAVPPGDVGMYKRADGYYRDTERVPLYSIGHRAGEYSRYDLERLREGTANYLPNLDYAVAIEGYTWPWTLVGDPNRLENYGKRPVRLELVDEEFYILSEGQAFDVLNTGDTSNLYRLKAEDYQIDFISYRITGNDVEYNEAAENEEDAYKPTPISYEDSETAVFYAKFDTADSDWVRVATLNLGTGQRTIEDNRVTAFSEEKISFADNCIGYRITTDSTHFFTRINSVPNARLKDSAYVHEFVQDEDAIGVYNEASANYYEYDNGQWKFIFEDIREGDVDYLRGVKRSSDIKKYIKATANETRKKQYLIDWEIPMSETLMIGTDTEKQYVEQPSGTFYDLLPPGSILNRSSVAVSNHKGYIDDGDFTVEQIPDYKGTGQTMLIVRIDEPGSYYTLSYETVHPWESIKDWGNEIYNPVAYETGNEDISTFNYNDQRGPARAKACFTDIIGQSSEDKFIYAQTEYDIDVIMAAAANLHKKVKDSTDPDYSYDTWTTINGDYSYRWRYQNTFDTKAKDLVFFDTLENYPVIQKDGSLKQSDWRGTLQSVDVSQLNKKGIAPVVYYSSVPNLDLEEHHDLTDDSIWKEASRFGDIAKAKAVAVDARKTTSGEDFVLQEGDAISVILNMKAPDHVDATGEGYPESYNNIYIENTTIDQNGGSEHFYIHQDYTVIRLRVTGELRLHKVNAQDQDESVRNVTFRLTGTSDYGTEVDMKKTTNRKGNLLFDDIEQGEYILQEYAVGDDWQEDHTEYLVKVDGQGKLTVDGKEYGKGSSLTISNKPRVHGDLTLVKKREDTSEIDSELVDEILDKGVGGKISYQGETYEIMAISNNSARMRIAPPEFQYPTLEDNGNDIASGVATDEHGNSLDWRITSGGELILGKPGQTQSFPAMWNGDRNKFWLDNQWRDEIRAVRFEGTVVAKQLDWAFIDAKNLKYADFNNVDTSQMTSMFALFASSGISHINWGSNFDTSKVKTLSQTFHNTKLEYLDLSSFDTSALGGVDNVPLWYTFSNTPSLKAVDLTGWKLENDIAIAQAFANTGAKAIYVGEDWGQADIDHMVPDWYNSLSVFSGSTSLPNYGDPIPGLTSQPGEDSHLHAYVGEGGYLSHYDKVSLVKSPDAPISGTVFELSGTSDYGNEVLQVKTTDENGMVEFSNIEKGTYELREIRENEDYIRNETVWIVKVDGFGNASLKEPVNEDNRDRLYQVGESGKAFSVENEPRYWPVTIRKVDADDRSEGLKGAKFTLKGLSDLGTEYDLEGTTDDEGNVTFDGLEKGTYILQEVQPPEEGTYIENSRQYILTLNYKGEVTVKGLASGENGEVLFPNEKVPPGQITVIKKWEDGLVGTAAANRPVPKLTLTKADGTMDLVESIDDHFEILDDSTWRYSFTVIDTEAEYRISEAAMDGYSSDAMEPGYVTVHGGQTGLITYVTNTAPKDTGKLRVSKTVTGKKKDGEFLFTIKLSGDDISGTQVFSDVIFNNGIAKIKLSDGEEKLIEDLPAGTTYQVTEEPVSRYEAEPSGNTGTIQKDKTAEAGFTNRYQPPDAVDLTLVKKESGFFSTPGTYGFTLFFTGLDGGNTYGMSNGGSFTANSSGDASVRVSLSGGDELTIKELPVEATWQISEDAGEYISSYRIKDRNETNKIARTSEGNTVEGRALSTAKETIDEGEDCVVTFTNVLNRTQDLSLAKRVTTSKEGQTDRKFEFTIQLFDLQPQTRYDTSIGRLTSDGDGFIEREVSLGDDDVVTFRDLPVGAGYRIVEKDYAKAGFIPVITISNSADVISDRTAEGRITEGSDTEVTYNNVEKTVISGTKTWEDGGLLHYNPGEIELTLERKSEGLLSLWHTVSDIQPEWKKDTYFFTGLDTLDEDGKPYEYRVKEAKIEGYETRQDGNDFTNTRDTGKLTVSKNVKANRVDKDKEFLFTVTLTNADGKPVSGTFSGVTFDENGQGAFTLKDGEEKTIETYAGILYSVEEEDYSSEGYITTADEHNTGTIEKGNTKTVFTNTQIQKGDLAISKLLTGTNAVYDDVFTFEIVLSDTSVNGTFNDVEFADGKAVVKLRGNEAVTIKGLPAYIEYTVTETDSLNYETTEPQRTGTLTKDKTAAEVFTNHRNQKPEKGKLTVSKKVQAVSPDKEKEFTFIVTLTDANGNPVSGTFSGVIFDRNGQGTIKLKDGQEKTIETDVGTRYSVQEKDYSNEGYITTADENKTGTISQSNRKTEFTNTLVPKGTLALSKLLDGTDVDYEDTFTFEIQLSDKSVNGTFSNIGFTDGKAEVKLKGNESVIIEGLPAGVDYTVVETDSLDYEAKEPQRTGKLTKDTSAAEIFTNHRDSEPVPEIHKVVNGGHQYELRRIDEVFTYDIFMTLPKRSDKIIITDDLVDVLQFTEKDKTVVKIGGQPLDREEQQKILSQKGKNLTVTLDKDQVKAYAGKEIRITFSVKIVEDADLTPYISKGIPNEAILNLGNSSNRSDEDMATLKVRGNEDSTGATTASTEKPTEASTITPTNPTNGGNGSGSRTGDSAHLNLAVILLMMAMTGCSIVFMARRRER